MPTGAQTAAGTVMSISAALPATLNATGFGALTFTKISEVTAIPSFGKSFQRVDHNPIDERQTYKFKGAFDNGSLAVQLGKDIDDAGQVIVAAALESDNSYSFEVVLNNGDTVYYTAKVFSDTIDIGEVNSIVSGTIQLEIDSVIVYDPA